MELMLREMKLSFVVEDIKRRFGDNERIGIGMEECVEDKRGVVGGDVMYFDLGQLNEEFIYEGGIGRGIYSLLKIDPNDLVEDFVGLAKWARQVKEEEKRTFYPLISVWEADGEKKQLGGYMVGLDDILVK